MKLGQALNPAARWSCVLSPQFAVRPHVVFAARWLRCLYFIIIIKGLFCSWGVAARMCGNILCSNSLSQCVFALLEYILGILATPRYSHLVHIYIYLLNNRYQKFKNAFGHDSRSLLYTFHTSVNEYE